MHIHACDLGSLSSKGPHTPGPPSFVEHAEANLPPTPGLFRVSLESRSRHADGQRPGHLPESLKAAAVPMIPQTANMLLLPGLTASEDGLLDKLTLLCGCPPSPSLGLSCLGGLQEEYWGHAGIMEVEDFTMLFMFEVPSGRCPLTL